MHQHKLTSVTWKFFRRCTSLLNNANRRHFSSVYIEFSQKGKPFFLPRGKRKKNSFWFSGLFGGMNEIAFAIWISISCFITLWSAKTRKTKTTTSADFGMKTFFQWIFTLIFISRTVLCSSFQAYFAFSSTFEHYHCIHFLLSWSDDVVSFDKFHELLNEFASLEFIISFI